MSEKKFDLKEFLKGIAKYIPWKKMLGDAYKGIRVKIAEKVAGTDPKWDDWLFDVLDKMALKFLGIDALDGEKDRTRLVDEAKAIPVATKD